MKISPIVRSDWRESVVAVPTLARTLEGSLSEAGNRRLLDHLRKGGVSTFLYGGNADLYNMSVSEFSPFVDMLTRLAGPDELFIPSVGADFGKALDQLRILRPYGFPTVMLLPQRFPTTSAGVATGIRRLADTYGKPLIVYMKDEDYLALADIRRLAEDGALATVKYGINRPDPSVDPYLADVVSQVGGVPVLSGMGELPAVIHLTKFGLTGFTSGCVCIAPRLSTAFFDAVKRGAVPTAEQLRLLFIPLEKTRDAHSPICVLHSAIRESGIGDMGPMQPFLSDIVEAGVLAKIREASLALLASNAVDAIVAMTAFSNFQAHSQPK